MPSSSRRVERRKDGGLVRHVETGLVDGEAGRFHLRRRGTEAPRIGSVQNDGGAGRGHALGHRSPEATGGSGDEGRPSFQRK